MHHNKSIDNARCFCLHRKCKQTPTLLRMRTAELTRQWAESSVEGKSRCCFWSITKYLFCQYICKMTDCWNLLVAGHVELDWCFGRQRRKPAGQGWSGCRPSSSQGYSRGTVAYVVTVAAAGSCSDCFKHNVFSILKCQERLTCTGQDWQRISKWCSRIFQHSKQIGRNCGMLSVLTLF